MAELRSCTPDFTLISYVEATQRLCVAVTDAAQRRLLVLADPLDARTRAWATHRLRRQGAQ